MSTATLGSAAAPSLSTSFPHTGSIDRDWIEGSSEEDPWLLISDAVDNPNYRDAFIGNGLIGLRVPPEGEGEAYRASAAMPPTGCLMHGLWSDDRLMAPPRWHGLGIDLGDGVLARDRETVSDYRQSLDLRSSTITTSGRWSSTSGKAARITTCMWLSLTDQNLLVIETLIEPEFDGTIGIIDSLQGVGLDWQMGGLMAPRYHFDEDGAAIVCAARMGERFRQVVARSVVDYPEQASVSVSSNLDHTVGPREIRRRAEMPVRAGQRYTVRKVAALVSDADAPDPAAHAAAVIDAYRADPDGGRAAHEAAWADRWQRRIVVGNPQLQRLLNSSLYQCYAQLPAGRAHSVGPAALSGMNWHGRAFWDADLWTFPVIGLLQPDLGRCFTAYRVATLEGARRNAVSRSYRGACFAWESAETGDEKVPAPMVHHQRHINACVALAMEWDRRISGDEDFHRAGGADVIIGAAEYFVDRVFWNEDEERYELLHIKCPDEFAGIRDNNATTNYACTATLRMAQAACQRYGREADPRWQHIIDHMWIPMDKAEDRILEYEGFDEFGEYSSGKAHLKQADATLLVYPWEMPMSESCKANTLSWYRGLYDENKIMMASAIDGIVDCELGDTEAAWSAFCDLLPHFRGPFLHVSERPTNECLSFITGLGGLLQLAVMGFGGLRIDEDGLRVQGCLPAAVGGMRVHGVHYAGIPQDLVVDAQGARLVPHEPAEM
jgi:trehalose/maltose hydrolase-like predicted phosphorylase